MIFRGGRVSFDADQASALQLLNIDSYGNVALTYRPSSTSDSDAAYKEVSEAVKAPSVDIKTDGTLHTASFIIPASSDDAMQRGVKRLAGALLQNGLLQEGKADQTMIYNAFGIDQNRSNTITTPLGR